MSYRIKTVSELTGIPKNTLVAWERRYEVLSPKREANGYRIYSDEDLAVLQNLKSALADGLKISEAVERVRRARTPAIDTPAPDDAAAFDAVREELRVALEAFDRNSAEGCVRRMMAIPHQVAIDEVYLPLLRTMGDNWHAGEITVAQEHFASGFVRDQLTTMLLGLGCGPDDGPRAACVTLPGERHELGALALAVCLALKGYRVTYLGADLPVDDLASFCSQHRPKLVCISAIMSATSATVDTYARKLRQCVPTSVRILIGGEGLPANVAVTDGVQYARDWHSALDRL